MKLFYVLRSQGNLNSWRVARGRFDEGLELPNNFAMDDNITEIPKQVGKNFHYNSSSIREGAMTVLRHTEGVQRWGQFFFLFSNAFNFFELISLFQIIFMSPEKSLLEGRLNLVYIHKII